MLSVLLLRHFRSQLVFWLEFLDHARFLPRVFEWQKSPPPPPKCPASFPKILLSLWKISNYIGKIIQTRRGQCTHCNITQNFVSKCTRLHLSTYSFQKISGGHSLGPPQEAHSLRLLGTSPPTDKFQIELWTQGEHIKRTSLVHSWVFSNFLLLP